MPSIRAGPALALGLEEEVSRPGPKPRAAPEIKRLARQGWSIRQIVEEGRRRKAVGQGGWSQTRAYQVVGEIAVISESPWGSRARSAGTNR